MEDDFSTGGGTGLGGDRGRGSGGIASDGERWGAADEASLICPPLTSCCVAQFLAGHGWVPVHGPGVGDPCPEGRSWPHYFQAIMREGESKGRLRNLNKP